MKAEEIYCEGKDWNQILFGKEEVYVRGDVKIVAEIYFTRRSVVVRYRGIDDDNYKELAMPWDLDMFDSDDVNKKGLIKCALDDLMRSK